MALPSARFGTENIMKYTGDIDERLVMTTIKLVPAEILL
jgi:hypothetical protein